MGLLFSRKAREERKKLEKRMILEGEGKSLQYLMSFRVYYFWRKVTVYRERV